MGKRFSLGLSKKGLTPLGVVVVLIAGPVFAEQVGTVLPQRVEAKDTNGDGKPDEWRYYQGDGRQEVLIRVERDRDGDGRREVVIFFENGKPVHSEVDRNGDGRPDITIFMKDGKPERESADTNFDGKTDVWVYYKNSIKDLMIRDKNFDGKPDAWFYYDKAGLKIIGLILDDNFDGKPDRTSGTVPKTEERKPW